MPSFETVALGAKILSSLLSIAASIKKFIQNGEAKDFDDAVEKYKSIATPETLALLNEEDNISSIHGLVNTIISPAVLDQLSEEAYTCEEVYIKNRRDAERNTSKLKGAEIKVKRCVCSTLLTLMKHNGGELPDAHDPDKDRLRKLFESHECDLHI
ncbi:hypothetical protein ND972_13855 [Vibrio diabolicus]|uniref:hypothetical protein n=1 Tax=Vibrio diabolicus TaxID=50719 RepID=UPI00215E787F|nr:hypothetical protein [Vibrio diabolicus]MCS0397881.1 hypothetical protein [Vibrio diabolicus]